MFVQLRFFLSSYTFVSHLIECCLSCHFLLMVVAGRVVFCYGNLRRSFAHKVCSFVICLRCGVGLSSTLLVYFIFLAVCSQIHVLPSAWLCNCAGWHFLCADADVPGRRYCGLRVLGHLPRVRAESATVRCGIRDQGDGVSRQTRCTDAVRLLFFLHVLL